MGFKHYKGENYLIEQYLPNTACILLNKPFVEDLSSDVLKKEIRGVLRPILEEIDVVDNNNLIYIDQTTEYIHNKCHKHNDIKIQIHLKFLSDIKFKEKVSIINKFINKIIAAI